MKIDFAALRGLNNAAVAAAFFAPGPAFGCQPAGEPLRPDRALR